MTFKHLAGAVAIVGLAMATSSPRIARAQGKAAAAKSLRCEFGLNSVATWNANGKAEAAVKPVRLLLRFESINTDEGSAELMNGTVASGVTVQLAARNLHFIQSFRSGPIYVTTVFDEETPDGKLKAVHSRHEYLKVPLAGSTSSPEQYYGECTVLN